MPGRNILYRHAAAQPFLAQGEQAVYRECINKVFYGFALVHGALALVYAVEVGAAVAGNHNAEDLFHRRPVIEKTAAGVGRSVSALPLALQLGQGQTRLTGLHEGLHKEYVFFYQFRDHSLQIYKKFPPCPK